MKNLARGSVLLSFTALMGFLFYFQAVVIAEGTFSIANDSKGNIQLENIQKEEQLNNQTNQQQTNQQKEQQVQETLTNDEKSKNNSTTVSEARSFRATAYCLQGRTATGGKVRRGIVAADPRVLPLGTRIQITGGAYSGAYTVADTGGAVRGRILDIWVPSCSEANRFGRRNVMVSVLGKGSKGKS
jgi:3D (Asp-Asp-Asp) domain-containing protein